MKDSMTNGHGWPKRGLFIHGGKKGRAAEKLNILAGMTGNEIVSPLTCSCNADASFFSIWIERRLLPELPEKTAVGLADASFRNTRKKKEIIESNGRKTLFLPPCWPDLNPLENFWASPEAETGKAVGSC